MLRLCAALIVLCLAASGEIPSAETGATSRQIEGRRLPHWLRLTGQLRVRVESPTAVEFRQQNDETDVLTRLRFGLLISPRPWLRWFAEWQDARAFGLSPPVPGSLANRADLRQAWIEAGQFEGPGWGIRFGRQPLRFGSGRLVWDPDWSNCGRTFDALRITAAGRTVRIDAFAASVVVPKDHGLDRSDTSQMFYGLYGAVQAGPKRLEPYLLLKSVAAWRGETGRRGALDIYTTGLRATAPLSSRADWEVEMAFQCGQAAREPVRAQAGIWQLHWQPTTASTAPRITASYSYASGDKDSSDGVRQTFDTLYPTTHLRNGATDRIGWANIHDLMLQAEWSLLRRLRLSAAGHDFRLATIRDALYSPSGAVLVRLSEAHSRHVGWELSLSAEYRFRPSLALGFGCAHLFPGAYLREAGRSGATQPYLFLAYSLE